MKGIEIETRIATPFPCSIAHVSVIDSFSVRFFCPKKLSSLSWTIMNPILPGAARGKDSGIWEIIVTLAIIADLSSLFESAGGGGFCCPMCSRVSKIWCGASEQWWLVQMGSHKWSDLAQNVPWPCGQCCLMFCLPEPHVGTDLWFQTVSDPVLGAESPPAGFRQDIPIYFDCCASCHLTPRHTPQCSWQDSEFAFYPDHIWLILIIYCVFISSYCTFSLPFLWMPSCPHSRDGCSLSQAWQSQASHCPLKIQILWVCSWEERIWMIWYLASVARTCFTNWMVISTDVQRGV